MFFKRTTAPTKAFFAAMFLGVWTLAARAQTLTDIGAFNPVPGPNDISQLSTNGNQTNPDGLNYFTDNQSTHNAGEPGQTFTTGNNPAGYLLTSVAMRTAGLGSDSGLATAQPYFLHLYAVADGDVAPLQTNLSANIVITDGDWLQWTGLTVPLAPNSTYAWSFGKASSASSWEAMGVASGNLYTGGELGLFPTAGGTITFGGSHGFDAVFDLGLATNTSQLLAGAPVVSPALTNYVGSPVKLVAAAAGAPPLHFQWQLGGLSGALTNLLNATNASLTFVPTNTGVFRFDFIVTNASGSATSSVAVVTIIPPATVTVNVSQPLAAMPAQGLGVCTAVYDGGLISGSIAPQLKAAGISAVRFPGGSYADIFNWENTSATNGAGMTNGGGYASPNDSFDNFMNTDVNPAGAHAIVTVNYGCNPASTGGGDPNVAAAWVAHANVTNNWAVKYWEIGNEVGGNGYYPGQDWEFDLHYPENVLPSARVGQPALSPGAYGTNSVQFITAMKAKDPTIRCGIGFSPGNNSYNTPLLQAVGTNADFVIIHWYPGSDAASTLAASTGIVATVASTFTELTNILGATHASQMKIAVTETGAGSATGAAVALFAADNYLTWIENGAVNVDYQILHNDILQANQTPGHAYYGAMMAHLLANTNDVMLTAGSSQPLLRVHAAVRQDGQTGVMLVNNDPLLTATATVSINGAKLATSGTWYQFGLTNFIGANDYPSYPVATNTVTGLGNQFTVSIPPYTMVDVLIPPAPTNAPPVLAAIGNQTVNVGQTVAFTASATDTNQPPPTLTFSLLSAPANAAVNATNGNFSWRPLVTQAGTTNAITLQVADNGSPSLSATQNFTVWVNPLALPTVAAIALSSGSVGFQVSGQTGPDYAVQVSSNLLNWQALFVTNSPAMPFQFTDTNPASLPAQFYRIKTGPPLP